MRQPHRPPPIAAASPAAHSVPQPGDCGEPLTETAAAGLMETDAHAGRTGVLGSDPTGSTVGAALATRGRVPWRSVGAGATTLGTPVALGVLHPMLGEAIAVVEIVVVLTIIVTALFGSQALSERAFRLLRWSGNRPEPPGPGDGTAGAA